jgi:hypothetical protein
LATPAPSSERVADLTLQTAKTTPAGAEPRRQWRLNVAASAALATVIGVLWVIFR